MECVVCGEWRGVDWRASQRQALCEACVANTPAKVSRSEFEKIYWSGHADTVPAGIRREFYSDYLSSDLTLTQYVKATTTNA